MSPYPDMTWLAQRAKAKSTFPHIKRTSCEIDDAVDPDIAGIGVGNLNACLHTLLTNSWVMIAALLSTVLTILYIIVGWSKSWISGFPPHPADAHIRKFIRIRRKRREEVPTEEKAKEDFQAVVLAFSDQQLVTGIALLTAAHIKSDVTVYTFQVATAVAWFSSTTHLATLVALREYFRKNKIARFSRMACMVVNAALLLASQIQSARTRSFPSWTTMSCVQNDLGAYGVIRIAFVSAWLVFAFVNRIVNICYNQSVPGRSWLFECIAHGLKVQPDREDGKWSGARERLGKHLQTLPEERTSSQELGLCGAFLLFLLEDIMNSLYWEILWLCFSLAYGLTGIIVTWTQCSQPTEELGSCWSQVLEMGLGQMIPLILLLLPVFTLLESFDKSTHKEENDTEKAKNIADVNATTTSNLMTLLVASSTRLKDLTSRHKEALGIHDKDPYETVVGKWMTSSLYIYLTGLFIAAGILSSDGVDVGEAGLIIVLGLVITTYFFGICTEGFLIIKAFGRKKTTTTTTTTIEKDDPGLEDDKVHANSVASGHNNQQARMEELIAKVKSIDAKIGTMVENIKRQEALNKAMTQPLSATGNEQNDPSDQIQVLSMSERSELERNTATARPRIDIENPESKLGNDTINNTMQARTPYEQSPAYPNLKTSPGQAGRTSPHEQNDIQSSAGPVLTSARLAAAKAQRNLQLVQERHERIKHYENGMNTLAFLYQELNATVIERELYVEAISRTINQADRDVDESNAIISDAIKLSRGIKKVKWWWSAIGVLPNLMLVLVLGLTIGLRR